MSLNMESLELLCSLVELDLSSLRLCDLILEISLFLGNIDGEFLDLKSQVLDLLFIGSSVFLESQMIFLFLSGSQSPLL